MDRWHWSSSTGLFSVHTLQNAPTEQNPINLKEYTSSVTSYIFPNQKAWINGGAISEKATFLSSHKEAFNTARVRLKTGIKEAKRGHQQILAKKAAQKHGRQFPVSKATKAGAPHHVCGHVNRCTKHILWFLWSPKQCVSCKIHATSRRPATVTIHSKCEKKKVDSECKTSCQALHNHLPLIWNKC